MSITPMWRVDLDGSMFTDKKAAEEHDKMLEVANNLSSLLEMNFSIDEKLAENIGLLLSRNKDMLARAFKGKPDLILEIGKDDQDQNLQEPPSAEVSKSTLKSVKSAKPAVA